MLESEFYSLHHDLLTPACCCIHFLARFLRYVHVKLVNFRCGIQHHKHFRSVSVVFVIHCLYTLFDFIFSPSMYMPNIHDDITHCVPCSLYLEQWQKTNNFNTHYRGSWLFLSISMQAQYVIFFCSSCVLYSSINIAYLLFISSSCTIYTTYQMAKNGPRLSHFLINTPVEL